MIHGPHQHVVSHHAGARNHVSTIMTSKGTTIRTIPVENMSASTLLNDMRQEKKPAPMRIG